jgi:hypothetical protein
MPVKQCQSDGKPGYKCGDEGKCYTYTPGNEKSRKNAKRKAILQCKAMDEPIEEDDLKDAFDREWLEAMEERLRVETKNGTKFFHILSDDDDCKGCN